MTMIITISVLQLLVMMMKSSINNPLLLNTPLKYNVFENIMENGAFALLQMLHFP